MAQLIQQGCENHDDKRRRKLALLQQAGDNQSPQQPQAQNLSDLELQAAESQDDTWGPQRRRRRTHRATPISATQVTPTILELSNKFEPLLEFEAGEKAAREAAAAPATPTAPRSASQEEVPAETETPQLTTEQWRRAKRAEIHGHGLAQFVEPPEQVQKFTTFVAKEQGHASIVEPPELVPPLYSARG